MTCKEFDTLTLLGYVAGDLSECRMASVDRHLRSCSECSGVVAEIKKEQSGFLEAYPQVPEVKATPGTILRFRTLTTLVAVAAVLVVAFGIAALLPRQQETTWRTKGGTALSLFVSDSTGQPSVREDSVFYPGERIQFSYSCGKERYLILASIDETGRVSVYYPNSGDQSMLLEPGNDMPLPHSIRLDDYIGVERYVAVFSGRPLDVAPVVEAIAGIKNNGEALPAASLVVPGATVRSVIINKKEKRHP